MKFDNSDQLNRYVADRQGGHCMLSFSCGKDSIVAWLNLRRFFHTITPVYLYLVPGLGFVETSLQYYEQFFEARIIRMPHPSLYRWLNNLTFQAPENCNVIESMGLPNFDYADVFRVVREDLALPADLYYATGVRAKDSPNRWAAIQMYGPILESALRFHCVYDYSKQDAIDTLRKGKVKLPIDYELFGRTFDGLDYRFLAPIKKHFPDDYAKILEFFPMADLELFRMETRGKYAKADPN